MSAPRFVVLGCLEYLELKAPGRALGTTPDGAVCGGHCVVVEYMGREEEWGRDGPGEGDGGCA